MKYIIKKEDFKTVGKIPLYLDDGTKTNVSLIIEDDDVACLYNALGCGEHIYLNDLTIIDDTAFIFTIKTNGIPQFLVIHVED